MIQVSNDQPKKSGNNATNPQGKAINNPPKKSGINATNPQDDEAMPLNKINYVMIAICLCLIALGFFLMSGSSNSGDTFNADVFNNTRTVVAPSITLLGFVLLVPAILIGGKKKS